MKKKTIRDILNEFSKEGHKDLIEAIKKKDFAFPDTFTPESLKKFENKEAGRIISEDLKKFENKLRDNNLIGKPDIFPFGKGRFEDNIKNSAKKELKEQMKENGVVLSTKEFNKLWKKILLEKEKKTKKLTKKEIDYYIDSFKKLGIDVSPEDLDFHKAKDTG